MTSPEEDTTKENAQTALVPTNNWQELLQCWNNVRGFHLPPWIGRMNAEALVPLALVCIWISLFTLAIGDRFLVLKVAPCVLGLGLLVISFLLRYGLTTEQKQIIADLEKVEDVQAVGPLLEMLDDATTQQARMALVNVLAGLLPRLTEADRNLLTLRQLAILYSALHSPPQITHPNPEFVAAALDAIGIVGDTNALPLLARIIVKDAPTRGEQAAREQARLSLHRLMQTLNFGTVQDIPMWGARLPLYSETSSPKLPSGANWEQSLIAMFALTRLLPQLTPEQASLLSRADRSRVVDATIMVHQMLSGSGTEGSLDMQASRLGADFKIAVITALRNVGTGEDAGHIRHWAYAPALSDADRHARDVAREALPILEARREKEKVSMTLLRGASAPPTAPDQLLRPALHDNYAARNARSEELLHPRSEPQTEQVQNLSL